MAEPAIAAAQIGKEENNAGLFRITKLNNNNYNAWALKLQLQMQEDETWIVITDEPPQPTTPEWEKKERKAKKTIVFLIEDHQLVHIKDKNAKQAWEALKVVHHRSSVGGKLQLKRQIATFKIDRMGNMRDHLDKLMGFYNDLATMGEAVSELDKACSILNSVYAEYTTVVTVIQGWEELRITWRDVSAQLISEWERRVQLKKQREIDDEAKLSRGTNTFKRNQMGTSEAFRQPTSSNTHQRGAGNAQKPIDCWECGVIGHTRANCPQRRAEIEKNVYSAKFFMNKSLSGDSDMYLNGVLLKTDRSRDWCMDSGAGTHVCPLKESFKTITKCYGPQVQIANGNLVPTMGIGMIDVEVRCEDKILTLNLDGVLWAPQLTEGLISVRHLTKQGYEVSFDKEGCFIEDKLGTSIKFGKRENGLFRLRYEETLNTVVKQHNEEESCIHQWHQRLGHRNFADIREMKKSGLKINDCDHDDDCEACMKGKMQRKPFPKKSTPVKEILDCVVSDVCGPMQTMSLGGSYYFITFIDVYSKCTEVHFMKHKSEVPDIAINFIEKMKTQHGRKPKIFRSDRGKEYLNGKLQSYLLREGIRPQCTVGYAPEQNGIAERKNRTLMEGARTMLADAQLPKSLWAEAVNTANFNINRVLSRGNTMTPHEKMNGEAPAWEQMHSFGCDVYAKIPDVHRRKLDVKAEKMRFVGYDDKSKGYRVFDGTKTRISRDVQFLTSKTKQQIGNHHDNSQSHAPRPREEEVDISFEPIPTIEEENYHYSDDDESDEDENDAQQTTASDPELPNDGNESTDESFVDADNESFQEELEPPSRPRRQNQGQLPVRYRNDYEMNAIKKRIKKLEIQLRTVKSYQVWSQQHYEDSTNMQYKRVAVACQFQEELLQTGNDECQVQEEPSQTVKNNTTTHGNKKSRHKKRRKIKRNIQKKRNN